MVEWSTHFLFQAFIQVMCGLLRHGSTLTLQTVHSVLLRPTRSIGLSNLLRWTTPMLRSTWLSTRVVRMSSVTNATLWFRTPSTACSVAWYLQPAFLMTGDSPTIPHGSSWFRSSPTSVKDLLCFYLHDFVQPTTVTSVVFEYFCHACCCVYGGAHNWRIHTRSSDEAV